MSYDIETILFTRFGIYNHGFKTGEAWEYNYEKRLNILLRYTKFSIENQTIIKQFKNFKWCFLIGDYVKNKDIDLIRNSIDSKIDVDFLRIETGGEICDVNKSINETYTLENKKNITMRIDSDDYLHPIAFEIIYATLLKHCAEMVIVGPSHGYKFFPENHIYSNYYRPKLAVGLSILCEKNFPVVLYNHRLLKDKAIEKYGNIKVIEDYDFTKRPMFINNRHVDSVSVGWGSYEKEIKDSIKEKVSDYDIITLEKEFKLPKDFIGWIK